MEKDTPAGKVLHLSQPEIVLYHESAYVGFSYPDLVLDKGRYYITETQKNIARVHEIPADFIENLFRQFWTKTIWQGDLLCDTIDQKVSLPKFNPFIRHSLEAGEDCYYTTDAGYTLEFWIEYTGEALLFDNITEKGQGLHIEVCNEGSLQIYLRDLRECSFVDTRKGFLTNGLHHVCIIFDGASRVACIVLDGLLEDGGNQRIAGWSFFSRSVIGIESDSQSTIGQCVRRFRLYCVALSTTQCIGNYRAGI